jgi:hypothetical protein
MTTIPPQTNHDAVWLVIRALQAKGYEPHSVAVGVDYIPTASPAAALGAITDSGNAYLFVSLCGKLAGWVRFVLGKYPADVIHDCSDNLVSSLTVLREGW